MRRITCVRLSHDRDVLQTICQKCGLPLRADYRLVPGALRMEALATRPRSLWRYEEVLPLPASAAVTLAEGLTPLIQAEKSADWAGANARYCAQVTRDMSMLTCAWAAAAGMAMASVKQNSNFFMERSVGY